MDAEVVRLIETVSLDAIKILGPAIIAAFATYKATKIQYEIKLQEITKGHEFKAREHLFDYYKERQAKLSMSHEELNRALSQLLGMSAASSDYDEGDSTSKIVDSFSGISGLYTELAPFEIEATLKDFESKGLSEAIEYIKLQSYTDRLRDLQEPINYYSIKDNVFLLLEVYSFLERCNQILLETQIERLFSEYVGSERS
ncbi:hypothetical protein [Thiohalophilus sp.]|uniref:hypothetical protein n=1 Tax=Thiohalophilus sp. TaxID=3028392 RepID=UPI002ACE7D18|nr:hypothetical protein [Thiohalophilus sp.]MDZ7661397.1 hypothetical protein [Thiohalophilus sp.]